MSEKELQKEVDWIRNQSKKVTIDLPDREPDEPPATEIQIRHIKRISEDLDEEIINKLGKKQASELINQLKVEAKKLLEESVKTKRGRWFREQLT